MNFAFTEEQIMLRDLAREILENEVTPERLKQVEASESRFDASLWSKLAEANLLGVAVPEAHGGMGMGFLELCLLLSELGRAVAPVPAVSALVEAALPLAAFGDDAQRRRWLPWIAGGEAVLGAALADAGSGDPARPAAKARGDEKEGWEIEGTKRGVSAAHLAERLLVPASMTTATDSGVGVFLVDPRSEGVELRTGEISSGQRVSEVVVAGARVSADDLLGGGVADGAGIVEWIRERATVATCALHLGVLERALEITAGYAKERHQFGAPIGSFAAVQHRAANGYIDVAAVRWTTWRAAWLLAEGGSASREVAVAKFWAADAGHRVVAATQHLHGGIGVDMDYPIQRYFLWSKALELQLGSATPQLLRLGRELARTTPQEHA